MTDLDALRAAHPMLGFAVYAYVPGELVTLEIKTPLDEMYQFKGATLAEAVALAGLWSPPVTTPTPAVEVDPFS